MSTSTETAAYPNVSPPEVETDDMVDQEQAVKFLTDSQLSLEQLTFPSVFLPGGTIGKHVRHAADHYNLLLKSVSGSGPYTLSYDVRVRNTAVESSPTSARDALLAIIETLKEVVPATHPDSPITMHAVTPFPAVMQTTFGRELWFASLHAIHHWSMIRVIAAEQGITVDEHFGVAPSTLLFRGKSSKL